MIIKSMELEPTKENLLQTMKGDSLERNSDVWSFARFCDMQEGKCSIALNAKWGYGKTFFVKQAKLLIESFNPHYGALTEDEKITIKSAFSRYMEEGENKIELQNQVCIYYDAWANDNDIDPILSLIYSIIQDSTIDYTFKNDISFIKLGGLIFDFFTGKNVTSLSELFTDNDPLSKLKEQKEIHKMVNDFFEKLLYERGNRLIIFIDELDRCKPDYAVKLLERIKHYFINDRITFVFSVNIEELQHAVKCHYGANFDSVRYLDRFFDYRFALSPANLDLYYREIGFNDESIYSLVCKSVIDQYAFGFREIEKYFRMSRLIFNKIVNYSSQYYYNNRGTKFALNVFVPIIIGLSMVDYDLYNEFINGKNPEPLISVVTNILNYKRIFVELLERNETFCEEENGAELVKIEDKLNSLYKAIFINKYENVNIICNIGYCSINSTIKNKIICAANLLSEYMSFE